MSTRSNLSEIAKLLPSESLDALSKVADIARSDTKSAVTEVRVVFDVTLTDDGCGSLADHLARMCAKAGARLVFANGDTEIYRFE